MRTDKIARLLADLFPPQKTRRIELIWDDITAMRDRLLTYPQISKVLATEYKLEVSPKHLSSIVRAVERKRLRRAKQGVPGIARQTALPIGRVESGPLDAARAQAAQKRERNEFNFGRKGEKNGVTVTDEDNKEA